MLNTKYKIRMRDAVGHSPMASADTRYEMQNVKGFSLIELVFAMSFLTLIIFGVVKLQSSNLAMMSGNNNQIQADLYANQGLQIIKGMGYSEVNTAYLGCGVVPTCRQKIELSGSTYSLSDNPPEEIGDIPFKRTVEISPNGLTSAYLVKVVIEWEDATGEHIQTASSDSEAKMIIFQ